MKTHGMSGTKLYRVWTDMISRCHNPNDTGYNNWGGRGVFVCEQWKDPIIFLEWAKPIWKQGLQIDRIDNNKEYCPDNCWFTTKSFQSINKRAGKNNACGHKGINWDKQKNKWRVRIYTNKKENHLGFFLDIDDAINARNKAVSDYKAMLSAAPEYEVTK